jgi:hypothetical protein
MEESTAKDSADEQQLGNVICIETANELSIGFFSNLYFLLYYLNKINNELLFLCLVLSETEISDLENHANLELIENEDAILNDHYERQRVDEIARLGEKQLGKIDYITVICWN